MTNRQLFDAIDRCEDEFVAAAAPGGGRDAGSRGKRTTRRRRRRMGRQFGLGVRVASAVIACVLIGGTGAVVASTVSEKFREQLISIFGANRVAEVELGTESGEDDQASEEAIGENAPQENEDLVDSTEEHVLALGDYTYITGVHESFVWKMHETEDEVPVTDHIYTIVDDHLEELTRSTFEGDYYGEPFRFEYVIVGEEICAMNESGSICEVFHHVDGDIVYAALWQVDGETIQKGCIASLNLRTGEVRRLTGDNMICNFLMSPSGEMILCNHRSDGYWSVYSVGDGTEKRVDAIHGYAHTKEIEFIDDYHIITLGGETIEESGEGESYGTAASCQIDLRTREVTETYPDYGDVTMVWSQIQDDSDHLRLENIMTGETIDIPHAAEGGQKLQCIDRDGEYVLFGSFYQMDCPLYLINLDRGSYRRLDIPEDMRSDLELYIAANAHKLLITSGEKGYLVDVGSL